MLPRSSPCPSRTEANQSAVNSRGEAGVCMTHNLTSQQAVTPAIRRACKARTSRVCQIGQGLDFYYACPVPHPMPHPAPLSALLSRVSAAFNADFERRLSDAGFPDMTFSLGSNVLRFLTPGGAVRMGSLTEMSGVTKQAISQQVAYLEARGYVAVEADAADSRAKLVRLTEKGQRSMEVAMSLFAALERDWQERFGCDQMRHLRALLKDILDSMNLPH